MIAIIFSMCYNGDMDSIKEVIGANLVELRKQKGLTQLELAEKFNYSDKSISKWEHGEAMPDVEILHNLASFYGVSLDFLVTKNASSQNIKVVKKENNNKIIISLLSVSLVWILATLFYVYFHMLTGINYWLSFLWAIPASCIVLIVFNAIWGRRRFSFWLTSCLCWSIITCVFLQLIDLGAWPIFLIGVPLQIAIILWSQLKPKHRKV